MRVESARAERAKAVRDAARGWHRTGFINSEVLGRITALYPDDRRRLGPAFRVLAFVLTSIAAWAVIGISVFFLSPTWKNAWTFFAGWAVVLAALTEIQRGPMKRANGGAESATGLIAVVFIVTSVLVNNDTGSSHALALLFFASTSLSCAIAAWRWGGGVFFLGGSLALFGLLAQAPYGRLAWACVALVLIPLALRSARSIRLAPPHRTGATIVGAVSLIALYASVHLWSWDQHAIESLNSAASFGNAGPMEMPLPRAFVIIATALLPPALLLAGWFRREPLLIYGGLLLIGVSLATIRLYRPVMPLSWALILMGGVCLTLALWLRSWLRTGMLGERHGFTADPLFDNANRTDVIRSAVAMASFSPAAQPAASPAAFEGQGGSFGGGGASGRF